MKAIFWTIFVFTILSCTSSSPTEPLPEIEEPVRDPAEFVVAKQGTLPLILSVPHGGNQHPSWIPSRECPDITTVQDANTIALADAIMEEFERVGLGTPYLVYTTLSREKMDANRSLPEATCGNEDSESVWTLYHQKIQHAKDSVQHHFGRGLLIDIHGHGHEIQRVELGYLLSGQELTLTDSTLNSTEWMQESSIRKVSETHPSLSYAQLLRGPDSFGAALESGGFPAIPSPTFPFPLRNEPYFNGGFITREHGSLSGGTIDAIQMECNRIGVRDSPENRAKFAKSFVEAVFTIQESWYSE